MIYPPDSKLPQEERLRVLPRNTLLEFLEKKRLKWSAPAEFGTTQEEITNTVRSRLMDPIQMTYDAIHSKTLKLIRR